MAEFTDASLSPRAQHMAEWLCHLTDVKQQRMFRDASCDLLLRELPDHWTAEDCLSASQDVLLSVGPKASRCVWLTAIGWLVGEEERLPERAEQPSRHVTRTRVAPLLAKTLHAMGGMHVD